jgi:hypothetical protein
MGVLTPPKRTQKVVPLKPAKGHFFFANKEFARVPWWKRPNMRILYLYIVILILTNTANGFDGASQPSQILFMHLGTMLNMFQDP